MRLPSIATVTLLTRPETVEDGQLILRPWVAADAVTVARAAADPDIALWNPINAGAGLEGIQAAMAWCLNRADWSSGAHASWAVVIRGLDAVAGSVSLFRIEEEQRRCEAGYWVSPEHRRLGVGSRALAAAVAFAFDRLDLHRVEIFHSVSNVASCRTAERAGLRFEGLHRLSHRYGDGRYHDEHSHAAL